MNRLMDNGQTRRIRAEECAPLAGDIVEIGFGTGLNLVHLPAGVTSVTAVDPLLRGRDLAAERIAASPVPVEFVGLDGRRSIADPGAAVAEIARVLRPGDDRLDADGQRAAAGHPTFASPSTAAAWPRP